MTIPNFEVIYLPVNQNEEHPEVEFIKCGVCHVLLENYQEDRDAHKEYHRSIAEAVHTLVDNQKE